MPRRLWVLGLGLGLVMAMLGAGSASAAPKKRPDLVVSAVSVSPGKVVAGGVLKVGDTTRNKGRKKAKRSVTRYALSANKKWGKGDVVLGSRAVKALKPGKKHTVKARSVRVAAATRPGTYWLLACADAKKKVRESHERNNCRVAKKRVTVTKRMPAGPRLPWENDGPGQMRQIDVDAKITISWKRWHTWFDSENNLADHSSATFDVSNAGQLIVSGGKPLFLRLYTFKSGTARGVRTFNEQSSCVTRSGEFRAGPESIARADGSPAAQWLVKFPHPVDSSRGVIGGALHTFRGHAPLHVDSCGDTSVSELTLEAEATHDGDVVGLDWSEDLTRVAFRHRKDLVNTQTRKLGSSADVKVVLTHRR